MGYRARLARALLLGRILWQLGYVRVAYGALNGEMTVFVGCRDRLACALLLGRILWQLGYVRVAYGALNVERLVFVGAVVHELLLPVETPQVQFLGCGFMPVEISDRCSSWTRWCAWSYCVVHDASWRVSFGLVFSHPEAQFLRAVQVVVRQCHRSRRNRRGGPLLRCGVDRGAPVP